jgi:hypothetical protein
MPDTFDPKFWRDSAAEARAIAERLNDPKSRRILKEIADRYDHLAEQAVKISILPAKKKSSVRFAAASLPLMLRKNLRQSPPNG